MIGKKIYWKKKSDAGKNVAWYGSNLDCSSRNLNKLKTGVTYKGTFTSKSITLYGSIDKASSMNDLWDFEKRKILVNKKRTYKISSKCRYFTLIESGKTKISSKKFYTIFTNSLGKNSSSAGIILLFKVSKGKIVDIGFSS